MRLRGTGARGQAFGIQSPITTRIVTSSRFRCKVFAGFPEKAHREVDRGFGIGLHNQNKTPQGPFERSLRPWGWYSQAPSDTSDVKLSPMVTQTGILATIRLFIFRCPPWPRVCPRLLQPIVVDSSAHGFDCVQRLDTPTRRGSWSWSPTWPMKGCGSATPRSSRRHSCWLSRTNGC
jgi:hypothetical protein